MTPENKKILLKKFESLIWRIGGVLTGFALAFISENIGLLELPQWLTLFIGLAISEATKYWNVDVPKLQGLSPRIQIFVLRKEDNEERVE